MYKFTAHDRYSTNARLTITGDTPGHIISHGYFNLFENSTGNPVRVEGKNVVINNNGNDVVLGTIERDTDFDYID